MFVLIVTPSNLFILVAPIEEWFVYGGHHFMHATWFALSGD